MSVDIQQFCGTELESRWGHPWIHEGRTYATNGSIAVRLNEPIAEFSEFEDKIGKRKPNIDAVLKPIESVSEWFAPPLVTKCRLCENKYKCIEECDSCFAGRCTCNCCELEHDCNLCEGTGEIENVCSCNTSFLNRRVANRYIEKISTLLNVRMGVAGEGIGEPIYFTFHGGVGCVMPFDEVEK